MFWKNDLISIAVNAEIVEYDIKHGNTSIMEAFQMAVSYTHLTLPTKLEV